MINIDWLIDSIDSAEIETAEVKEEPKQIADISFKGEKEVKPDGNKNKRNQETFGDYIKKCGELRNDIAKGVACGVPMTELFLMSVECIAQMTENEAYYRQIKNDVIGIRGYGLQETEAIELELKQTERNIEHINQALGDSTISMDHKQRLEKSLKLHNEKVERLSSRIKAVSN